MDLAEIATPEELALLKKQGLQVTRSWTRTWPRRIRHALLGCTKIPYMELDTYNDRVVERGRICPVCYREYP